MFNTLRSDPYITQAPTVVEGLFSFHLPGMHKGLGQLRWCNG